MATCRFCGQSAGWFRSEHAACAEQHAAALADAIRKRAEAKQIGRVQLLHDLDQVYALGLELPSWPGAVPPINLVGGERVVWLFENVEYLADKRKRSYNGVYGGPSVRVMRGVSLRLGAFHGAPHTAVDRVSQGVGSLILTTSNLYFYSAQASIRVPYKKVTSYIPHEDGVGVMKDSATALPLTFVTGSDMAFEIITRVSRIATNVHPHTAGTATSTPAVPAQPAAAQAGDEQPTDALYASAVRVVLTTQRATISGVQRHLRIGFSLATKLIERMEAEGIVSAPQADGARRVLVEQP